MVHSGVNMAIATAPEGANQTDSGPQEPQGPTLDGFRPDVEPTESANHVQTMYEGRRAVAEVEDRLEERFGISVDMMDVVRVIGGAMIGIAVLVVVLNEVFSLDAIANDSGPFADVITSLETTGGAALGLLVIGLLVVGANRVMGFFGGGGGF
jgi:hypothetical protein